MKTIRESIAGIFSDSERFGYLLLALVVITLIICITVGVIKDNENNLQEKKIRIEQLKANPLEEDTITVNGVKYKMVK